MKTIHAFARGVAVLSVMSLMASVFIPSEVSAQGRRVFGGMNRRAAVTALPGARYPVFVNGRRYFYNGGFFYTRGVRGYVMVPAPIGARVRFLPYGFVAFNIGVIPYYYYGGVYYQYIPDENCYVVVQKPSEAPSSATAGDQDEAVLTDGTTLTGVFQGANEDSIQFEVNGKVRSIPIPQISSIHFAPSSIDTTAHK